MSSDKSINWNQIFSLKAIGLTLLGVASAVVAFKGFMIPNHFIDGGLNGISILISESLHINIAIPLILINIPFIFLGYKKIGKNFAILSLIAIILLALALQFVSIPTITEDNILIALFGGLFIGLAIGLIIRAGGVIDGLETIALYTTQKSKFSTNELMLLIACIVFISLGLVYGWDKSMYSILTYFTALRTADYVVDGFEEYTSLTIVSAEYEQIKEMIVRDFDKAVSVYKGERGYLPESFESKHECDIIVTIMTRLETHGIQQAIYKIDPKAFLYTQSIKEVKGGIVKQLRSH